MSTDSRGDTSRSPLEPEKPLRYRTFAGLVTRSASRCAAVIPSTRSVSRRDRASVMGRETRNETAQRELVAEHPQPAYHAHGDTRERRVPALRLAGVDVGDVHFDERHLYADERVPQREAGVRVRAGVHERSLHPATHRLNRVDERALAVVLRKLDVDAQLLRYLAQALLHVRERGASIELRLPRAQQIEIGPVQNRDSHFRLRPWSQEVNCATSSGESAPLCAAADGADSDAAFFEKNWSKEKLEGVAGAACGENTESSDSSLVATRAGVPAMPPPPPFSAANASARVRA